jgi:hypothetical protein
VGDRYTSGAVGEVVFLPAVEVTARLKAGEISSPRLPEVRSSRRPRRSVDVHNDDGSVDRLVADFERKERVFVTGQTARSRTAV